MVTTKRDDRNFRDILETLRVRLPEVRDRYHVTTLGVFGSYVRGQQGRGSDLDVLVEFSEAPTFLQFLGLEEELCAVLGVKVDLVMKKA
ncbi:MAG: nucleotidyltransferase family protein, partial [Dehalococcoidia bacterium]|nr:nucleotidyltransferase family protein [Dehalococcoidia bacterium]